MFVEFLEAGLLVFYGVLDAIDSANEGCAQRQHICVFVAEIIDIMVEIGFRLLAVLSKGS